MGFVPLRWIFRSRYAALLWACGICWTAYDHAKSVASVDAANSADSNAAQLSAALAEEED